MLFKRNNKEAQRKLCNVGKNDQQINLVTMYNLLVTRLLTW